MAFLQCKDHRQWENLIPFHSTPEVMEYVLEDVCIQSVRALKLSSSLGMFYPKGALACNYSTQISAKYLVSL